MNPLLILLVFSMLDQKRYRKHAMPYFDTFKMEMLLDKFQGTVSTLDKVNRLSQIVNEPRALKSMDHANTNLPAPLDALGGLGQFAPLLAKLGQPDDLKNLMNNLAPVMNMLIGTQETQQTQEKE